MENSSDSCKKYKINGTITSNNDYDIIYELGSEKYSYDRYGTNTKFTKRFEIKYKNPVYEEIKVYTYPENESLCTKYPIGTPKIDGYTIIPLVSLMVKQS